MATATADKDKWGIPFFYRTADDAGVSGKGTGFFWQQDNNIFNDSKKGMVRIGKEFDDVKVINSSTGEWEFPYDKADYYALEISTGHHSGGVSHGCQGAGYIGNVTIVDNNPEFYFQKQMFHGGHKHEKGRKKHPKFTQKIVGNGWFGFAMVRYNIKNGRSTGHDSVKLEMWANPNPSQDIKNWIKVNEIEDKGGWGSRGDTCDGTSDQILTWSNVQHRFKSGTPEWSLHPRIPEFEDGDNIHSIGKENMDFAASEKRGYGKREDMPRDLEMKILFKFDSNNGIARLKNASLREINPMKAVDDTGNQPPPTDAPTETETIQGKFKFMWDLNTIRASECAGVGTGNEVDFDPGDGGTGKTRFYILTTKNNDQELCNHVDWNNITIVAQHILSSLSRMRGKKPGQLDIFLKKVGSPTSSISCKIWNGKGDVVYTSPTTVSASGLTTSYVKKTFDFASNTRTLQVGDRIGIQYTGSSNAANYVVAPYDIDVMTHSCMSTQNNLTSQWTDSNFGKNDLSMEIWTQ